MKLFSYYCSSESPQCHCSKEEQTPARCRWLPLINSQTLLINLPWRRVSTLSIFDILTVLSIWQFIIIYNYNSCHVNKCTFPCSQPCSWRDRYCSGLLLQSVWKLIIKKLENVPSHRKISVVKLQFLSEAGVGGGDPRPSYKPVNIEECQSHFENISVHNSDFSSDFQPADKSGN